MIDSAIDISIVVPVFNSAKIIPELTSRIQKAMETSLLSYELILTDDCSTDNSWQVISEQCVLNPQITGLRLSKNCGQWCSTLAGITRAMGKYIVTIDDDLEYEPADIPKLYEEITGKGYYVVFGIPKEKYLLQGKNPAVARWRKNIMHKLWNSPPTDSFRIFTRNLVFDKDKFLPRIFLDAFVVHNLDERFIGYIETRSNKRYAGVSNVPLLKRINLFFLYSTHFATNPVKYVVAFAFLFLFPIVGASLFCYKNLPACVLGSLLLLTGLFNLYYLLQLFWKCKNLFLYLIIEEISPSNHSRALYKQSR